MNRLLSSIRRNFRIISAAFYFLACTMLIMYMFPRQGKFKYEFQKGSPWRHADLHAEFDFPIYKTPTELNAERDSALRGLKPYFVFDTSIGITQVEQLRNDFNAAWEQFIMQKVKIEDISLYKESNLYADVRRLQVHYADFLANHLLLFYEKGILDLNAAFEAIEYKFNVIMLVKGNIAMEQPLTSMNTQKSAYEQLSDALVNMLESDNSANMRKVKPFFATFDLSRYVRVNVNYDESRTRIARNTILETLSLSRGMVQEGQRIISRGELVTPEKFQVLESFRQEFASRLGTMASRLVNLGTFILIFSAMFVIFLFLYNLRREILLHNLKSLFILFLVVLLVFTSTTIAKTGQHNLYIIPVTILPIVLRTFYDERLALFIHFIVTILLGFLAPNGFEFVFLTFIAGIIAVFSLTNFYRRSRIVVTSLYVFLSYSTVYFGISVLQEGNLTSIEYSNFRSFAVNSFFILLSFPIIYIFEKTFGFLSDATLIELADTNQPLLRELAEKAPGTFQHSLQVANLAEEAVFRIGGNPLLVRTGALYHDIGKLDTPYYFIENQSGGINPHDELPFEQSAKIIIGHVEKGVVRAKRFKLPEPLIDFIRTHHGTSTVQYFYRSYLKNFPNEEVDIRKFMYPGPKPFSKETAVLMMADSVEAASRSLQEFKEGTIEKLVEKILGDQLTDEQFNNADITFKDISTIKEVFIARLKNIYHVRVVYPA